MQRFVFSAWKPLWEPLGADIAFKIEEIGREKVNLNQFYVKFGCTAYFPPPEEILPQPKPKIDTLIETSHCLQLKFSFFITFF